MQKINMQFLDVIWMGSDKVLFYDRFHMGLYCMDEQMKNIRLLRNVKDDVEMGPFHAMKIYRIQDELYITSHCNTDILKYDIKKNMFSLVQPERKIESVDMYNTAFIDNRIIYIPQNLEHNTYLYNVTDGTYITHKWFEKENMPEGVRGAFIYQQDNNIWIPILGTNCICKLNGKTLECKKVYIDEDIHVNSIYADDEKIWISQSDKAELYILSDAGAEHIRLDETDAENMFSNVLAVENKAVLLPRFSDSIYLYDSVSKKVKKIKVLQEVIKDEKNQASLFVGYHIEGHKVYLWPWRMSNVYILDIQNECYEVCELEVELSEYIKITGQNFFMEENNSDLIEFIKI